MYVKYEGEKEIAAGCCKVVLEDYIWIDLEVGNG